MNINITILVLCILTLSCSQDKKQHGIRSTDDNSNPQSTNSSSVVSDTAIYSILKSYMKTDSPRFLVQLDSISCSSDGDTAEELDEIAVEAYNFSRTKFFERVYSLNLSCLKRNFVSGMSANTSVFKGAERQAYLKAIYQDAENAYVGLTQAEAKASKRLIEQINPSQFD